MKGKQLLFKGSAGEYQEGRGGEILTLCFESNTISQAVAGHVYMVLGGAGAGFHDRLHNGDAYQDLSAGIHAAQGELHAEPVELYGFLCCDVRVG